MLHRSCWKKICK